ncbi:Fe(3+)-hydroxamate ABC transporter permease FhuB [Psittacicella gerlachiana]|uniref:Fe3+-hydroxamate ABC transporter permease FhuB n=1 Tax=Psittacicella gerlachiana TaxID=2028574 RepID=A0A3A1YP77_9GAMM|nr:Fe(3+)-hydroxamate ABC transporter permease FhuB [Psittacicella gerlachiana]RIY38760.1 Fe3+-hydroxamate ABC transporter permease FhuB [Psittacicella gerlachiana]
MVRKLNIFALGLFILATCLFVMLSKLQLQGIGFKQSFSLYTNNLQVLLWQNYTLPRVSMAILSGIGLGIATVILQQLTKNTLASDNTLAVSSGAQLAIVITFVFFPNFLIYGTSVIAFIGAFSALYLVLIISMQKTTNHIIVVLAGMVVGVYLAAISSTLILIFPEETRSVLTWSAGSLVQDSWLDSFYLSLNLLISLVVVVLFIKPLNMLSLDEASAVRLGVPVNRIRIIGLIIAAYIVAIVIARVGMLGFIGLISATITRSFGSRTFKQLLFYTPIVSALLLLVTDLILNLINYFYQIQIPTGAVTSLVGTPVLLWLMFKDKSGAKQKPTSEKIRIQKINVKVICYLLAITTLMILVSLSWDSWKLKNIQELIEILELRSPRLLLVIGAGVILALSGLVLQRISNNPLASPELMGITSGVNLGIMLSLFFVTTISLHSLTLGGIIGALVVLVAIMVFSLRGGLQPEKILMVGISITALYDACLRIFMATNDFRAYTLLNLTSGSTYYATFSSAFFVILISLLFTGIILFLTKQFEILNLQVTIASQLGLNIFLFRLFLIVVVALVVTIATINIGAVSFVGLLAPHAARALGFYRPKLQILVSILISILVMVIADFVGRNLIYPYELPVGLMSTLIGGLYFIILMKRL